jgi:DNA (cytosine-5)-methyltransferase 1
MTYTVVDLFCGCGGFSKGLSDSGLNVLVGIDKWDVAVDTYKNNNQHIAMCKDLTNYPPTEFENGTNVSKYDILVGGPPCQ